MGATFSHDENDPLIRKVENLKVFMSKLKVEQEKGKEVASKEELHELFMIDLCSGTCCIPLFLPFFEFFHLCCHPCQQGKFHKEECLYLKRCFLSFSYLMEILCVEATKNLPI
jgi:hypothetical protein